MTAAVSVVLETKTLSRFGTERRGAVLVDALDCLHAGQPPAELIVAAAEGSQADELGPIVARYPASRLITISAEQPATIYRMKNAGAAAAVGDIVAFADADTRVSAGWVEAIAGSFADPAVGGSAGWTRYESSGLKARIATATDFGFVRALPDGSSTGVIAHNVALRRAVALEFPFDERFVKTGACGHLYQRLVAAGVVIVFNPAQGVIHTDDFRGGRWLAKRVRNGADITKVGELAPTSRVERWTPRGTFGFPLHVAARRAAGDVVRLARDRAAVNRPVERPLFIAAAIAGRTLEGGVGVIAQRRPQWVALGTRWG